jgi:hypothetical protein
LSKEAAARLQKLLEEGAAVSQPIIERKSLVQKQTKKRVLTESDKIAVREALAFMEQSRKETLARLAQGIEHPRGGELAESKNTMEQLQLLQHKVRLNDTEKREKRHQFQPTADDDHEQDKKYKNILDELIANKNVLDELIANKNTPQQLALPSSLQTFQTAQNKWRKVLNSERRRQSPHPIERIDDAEWLAQKEAVMLRKAKHVEKKIGAKVYKEQAKIAEKQQRAADFMDWIQHGSSISRAPGKQTFLQIALDRATHAPAHTLPNHFLCYSLTFSYKIPPEPGPKLGERLRSAPVHFWFYYRYDPPALNRPAQTVESCMTSFIATHYFLL